MRKLGSFIFGLLAAVGLSVGAQEIGLIQSLPLSDLLAGTAPAGSGTYDFGANSLAGSAIAFTGGALNGVNIGASVRGTALFTSMGANGGGTVSNGFAASGTITLNKNAGTATTEVCDGSTTGACTVGGGFNAVGMGSATTFSLAGAASVSPLLMTGAPFTAGSATTNFPLLYLNDGTAPSTWSASGTEIGVNAPSGWTGNFFDLHINGGGSLFRVTSAGGLTASGIVTGTGGATVTGNTVSLNANSNFPVNIGTGTTTSTVTLGGGANDVAVGSHIASTGSAPTVSGTGCAASATPAPTDTRGAITATAATSCTVTFAATYTSVPVCVATASSTTIPTSISSVSATAVTFGMSALTGTIYYWCVK